MNQIPSIMRSLFKIYHFQIFFFFKACFSSFLYESPAPVRKTGIPAFMHLYAVLLSSSKWHSGRICERISVFVPAS